MTATLIRDANLSVRCLPSSFQIVIHDFANLSDTTAHFIPSPKLFTCNEHQWQLEVHPGGDSEATEGQVSIYLRLLSQDTVTTSFGIKVIDEFGNQKRALSTKHKFTAAGDNWGWPNFISRSEILDESKHILDSDGKLTFVVSIEEEPTHVFVPKNPLNKMIEKMFNDKATADVCFEVSRALQKKEKKKTKSYDSVYAHLTILQGCAPLLAAICGSDDSGVCGVVTVSVNDIKPRIFRLLLAYVYGKTIPGSLLKAHAKDIIAAADKYSIVNLKLAAEAAYVQSTEINLENAMDNLLYADSMNLALLKEAAIDFLVENPAKATEKASFDTFPAHLLKDVFVAINKVHGKSGGDDAFAAMSVSELRKKLDEKGLEVDGSREAMIESIKSNS